MVILKITIDALIENDVTAAAAAAAAADDDDDDDDNDDDLIFTIVTEFCHIYINISRSNLYYIISKMIIQWKSFRTESPRICTIRVSNWNIYIYIYIKRERDRNPILQDVTYNNKRGLFPYIRNGFIVRPESIASTKYDFKVAQWH